MTFLATCKSSNFNKQTLLLKLREYFLFQSLGIILSLVFGAIQRQVSRVRLHSRRKNGQLGLRARVCTIISQIGN
jgi:hypothetical protein